MSSRLALAALLSILLAAGCAGRSPGAPADRDGLLARERGFLAASADRDAGRTAAFFAEDAVLHVANMPAIRGRTAIEGFYGNVFRFMAASEATPQTSRISAAGDLAFTTGSSRNAFDGPQGRVAYEGKYLLAWERVGGEWMIAAYALSNDASEPAR